MYEKTIIQNKKYLVSFKTKFIVHGKNHEEALKNMKSEILKKINEEDPSDTTFSIHLIAEKSIEEEQSSYHDDWDFDDLW